MTSQDGLALLKQMHQRGEITDEQYDTLRRHVLWGTALPANLDAVPPPRSGADPSGGYVPGSATIGPDRFPGPPGYPDARGRPPGEPAAGYPGPHPAQPPGQAPRRYASRRERREAEQAHAEGAHPEAAHVEVGALRGGLPAARRKHRTVATGTRGPAAAAPARRHGQHAARPAAA